jgi:hypothetical protein
MYPSSWSPLAGMAWHWDSGQLWVCWRRAMLGLMPGPLTPSGCCLVTIPVLLCQLSEVCHTPLDSWWQRVTFEGFFPFFPIFLWIHEGLWLDSSSMNSSYSGILNFRWYKLVFGISPTSWYLLILPRIFSIFHFYIIFQENFFAVGLCPKQPRVLLSSFPSRA